MFDFSGKIYYGQKGDSDPSGEEWMSGWPISGSQRRHQSPGRVPNAKLRGQSRVGSQKQGQQVESKEKIKEVRGSKSILVPAVDSNKR